jgi:predicted nuclease of predicted toxin-antitoxin system
MRFKIDENLHDEVAALFAQQGHDAETVLSEGLRGSHDESLARHCHNEGRILVTLDLDFADIRSFPPAASPGIIVLRVNNQSRSHVFGVVQQMIGLLNREAIDRRLWIVTEAGVRIRGS